MTETYGKIYHVLGLEESILSKWLYTQSSLQIQCNPYQITNGIFHRIRAKKFTICMETQKTLNSQSNLVKEKRTWRNQAPWFHTILQSYSHQNGMVGLPWWCSGWESACRCRGHGFEPLSGKIPHATEQLGPWATTTEPARLEPVFRNKRRHDSERPMHRDEEWSPLAATRESPRTETKIQHSQK